MRCPRVLITAGPTHEPIDEVRYLANRSSGRIGIEIAEAALDAGWITTLALGPTHLRPRTTPRPGEPPAQQPGTQGREERFQLVRFRTTSDLEALLTEEAPNADILIMAAAVADFRPVRGGNASAGKIRRTGNGLTLELESTPDLLAGCMKRKQQTGRTAPALAVAFALEPAEGLLEAARRKLERKGADLIVANPLKTMDAALVEAHLVSPDGVIASTPGEITKQEFGAWLVDQIRVLLHATP